MANKKWSGAGLRANRVGGVGRPHRSRVRLAAWWLALGWLVAAPGLAQEQAPQSPSIRADGGYSVVVDAVVTDKKNRVLTDLQKSDFVIYEDGVQQTIETFQLIQPDDVAEIAAPAPGAVPTVAQPAQGRRRNLIIFLLDYATTRFENQKLVEDASRKYIEENLRPEDLVAVFSLSNSFRFLQDFTNDKELLLAALTRGDARGNALASSNPAPAVPAGGRSTDTLSEPAAPANTPEAAAAAAAGGSSRADLMLAQRIEALYRVMSTFLNRRQSYSVLAAIQAISEGVREVSGRKTLVLFSEGFVVGAQAERELAKTIGLANRANVAIYGVDSQGLATRELSGALVPRGELSGISADRGEQRIRAVGGESVFDRAKEVGSDARDSALRYVSAATGGFAIRNSNDLYLGMQRIDQDVRSYYLLSYRPSNLAFDGEFKTIRVEVTRKDVQVRARSGYVALPPGMELVSSEEFDLLRRVRSGAAALDFPTYFRVDKLFDDQGGANLLLTLEIPAPEVRFEQTDGEGGAAREGNLAIIGLVRDALGVVVTRFGAPLNLRIPEAEWASLRENQLSFSNAIQLPPGNYSFDVVVHDVNGDRTGRAETALRLPPAGTELRLSSIVLGTEVRGSASEGGVLTHDGTRVVPAAERRFDPRSKLIYYFDICGFQRDASGNPRLEIDVSLKPSGSAESIALTPYEISQADAPARVSASRFVELAGLPTGTYFLQATVTDLLAKTSVSATTTFQLRD